MSPEVKRSMLLFELAVGRITDLYNLAIKCTQGKHDGECINMYLVKHKDVERTREQLEEAYLILLSSDTFNEQKQKEINDTYSKFQDIYYSIQVLHSSVPTTKSTVNQPTSNPSFHLPKISLARFTGVHVEWPNFIAIFNSLIHNNAGITPVEKMHYLLSVLDKEPLSLIKHLIISNENYNIAYSLLVERYENKRIIADKHVEAILCLPNLSSLNFKALNKFLNTIKEHTQALTALNFDVDSWSFLLLHIILKKLSIEMRSKFESIIKSTSIPSFKQLLQFLENQLRILENISGSSSKPQPSNSFNIVEPDNKSESKSTCPCCNENHQIYKCTKFDSMTPKERKAFVIHNKLCFNCLRTHQVSKCSSRSICRVCQGRHHTKLHIQPAPLNEPPRVESTVTKGPEAVCSLPKQSQSLHSVDVSSTMLLGTALVRIQDVDGHYHSARALIDSGSQVSVMTESLAQKLRLQRSDSGTLFGLGASPTQSTRGTVHCNIKPLSCSQQVLDTDFIILKRVTNNLPSVLVDQSVLSKCDNLVLADRSFISPGPIDLLLGIDLYDQIFDGGKYSLGENMPTAYSSIFGWVIMGKAPAASRYGNRCTTSMACTANLDLALNRFWEVEEPPKLLIQDPENVQCEKHFSDTHARDESGRFILRLPFKIDHKPLGDTHVHATKRFYNLERRLLREPALRELYIAFMRDYLEAGHMREVNSVASHDRYYIPHHGVLKEHSSTTKLRAVFDATFPSSSGVSLNQVLLSGPKLQKNIEDIILRFRLHVVVFTCDIKQMYRQVRIADEDCKYQTILWRESPDEPLKQFELTTVTYGVTSSAYQAIRVVHELAYLNSEKHSEASRALLEDTFVDDVVSGAACLSSAKDLQQQLVGVLSQGGFLLRKWSSNSQDFLESVPADHCESPFRFEPEGDNVFKVLGIQWNANTDSFVYHVSEMSSVMTKRGILSNIARLYDPCGFLAPVTFHAKHIMQRLWSIECGWDDPLPADILQCWSTFVSDFCQLNNVCISRRVLTDQPVDCQLHGFSDASERGYAACVYLRTVDSSGHTLVQLLLAKSRVAPLKQKLTVPKLELNGALMLARLLEHVLNVLSRKTDINSVSAWCDSSIVLSWLATSPHKLQTFEGNRVSQVQSLIPTATWRHVPSLSNPADSASRGCTPSELVSNHLWWSPAWLEGDSSTWPGEFKVMSEASLPGIKPTPLTSNIAQVQDSEEFLILERFSTFSRLQSVIGWCKRFFHNCKQHDPAPRHSGPLSVAELDASSHTIIGMVQSVAFPDAVKSLQAGTHVKGSLMRLNPFLDRKGLLRVGGRLVKSSLEYSVRHPLLLPKSHHVTRLIIEHHHRIYLHPGLSTLLNLLQRKFWIMSARRMIRHVIFQCHRCYRLRPRSVAPFMGDLPADRVTSCRPYQKVGVDFAGPFLLKTSQLRNAKSVKAYLCIYVCFTTKAVHLEVVSELSTDAFLACFDRFVSRRGLPSDIFSDCGTNFVGARARLKEVSDFIRNSTAEIHQHMRAQQVTWHFNPPASPHMGGLWESAVRSAKLILARVISDRPLVFEELATIFAKVEAALNSRPLCPLSNDPNDLEVLTPGHFIIGQPLLAAPDHDIVDSNTPILKRWLLLRQITQHFWKRWQSEYLHTLQQRPKWLAKTASIQLGDLVLIKDPRLPPLQWRKARVIRICPGSDGVIRVVELKTSTGTLLRPIVKLCPLLPSSELHV